MVTRVGHANIELVKYKEQKVKVVVNTRRELKTNS